MISRGNTVWTPYPAPQPRTLSQQRHPYSCTFQNIILWPYTMRHSAMSMSVSWLNFYQRLEHHSLPHKLHFTIYFSRMDHQNLPNPLHRQSWFRTCNKLHPPNKFTCYKNQSKTHTPWSSATHVKRFNFSISFIHIAIHTQRYFCLLKSTFLNNGYFWIRDYL